MIQHYVPTRQGRGRGPGRMGYAQSLTLSRPTASPMPHPPRRGTDGDLDDDGMRIYGGDDGIRVFSADGSNRGGSQSASGSRGPPPSPIIADGSNTARIIARRRGLDGSHRSGVGRTGHAGGRSGSVRSGRSNGSSGRAGRRPSVGSAASHRRRSSASEDCHNNNAPPPPAQHRNGGFDNLQRRITVGDDGYFLPPSGNGMVGSKSYADFHPDEERPSARLLRRASSFDNLDRLPFHNRTGNDPPPRPTVPVENPMHMLQQQRARQQARRNVEQRNNPTNNPSNNNNNNNARSVPRRQNPNNTHQPNPATDRGDKLKLYDELLSASDPKIGRWIDSNNAGQTASITLPSDAHTHAALNMGGGLNSSYGDKPGRRACGKKAAGGLAALLLGMVGVGLAVWFVKPWESDGGERSDDAAGGDADGPDPSLVPADEKDATVDPPPADIEGRCSPSNLPGSLSACLLACIPSACCYENYSGRSCSESNACDEYRPHCDVFYDSWDGATDGKLRDADDSDGLAICNGSGDRTEGGAVPISSRKRVRGRSVPDGGSASRRLESAQETCRRHCLASKCCTASVVADDPSSFGLSVSPSGVYTDASTDEFIMTNCRESHAANGGLCEVYDKFCNAEGVSERVPVPLGLESAFGSSMPSARPAGDGGGGTVLIPITGAPSSTMSPTTQQSYVSDPTTQQSYVSDPAPSSQKPQPLYSGGQPPSFGIMPSSSSQKPTTSTITSGTQTQPSPLGAGPSPTSSQTTPFDANSTDSFPIASPQDQTNETLITPSQSSTSILPASPEQIQQACSNIASGDAARNECVGACQDGLCCYSVELGYDWIEPCYVGNELACEEYADCLVLRKDDAGSAGNSSVAVVGGENATISGTYVSEGSQGTTVSTNETTATISTANAGTSATTITEETSTEAPAEPVKDDGPPVQDLSALCSNELTSDAAGLNQCIEACSLGQCCGVTDERSCITSHAETCELYAPCNAAYAKLASNQSTLPPAPPENIDSVCSYDFLAQKGTAQCMAACEPGVCCSDNSCIQGGKTQDMVNELNGICSQYSSCNNLAGMPEPPKNMSQVCSDPSSETCAATCSTASCCFLEQGPVCYTMYAAVCDLYRPYCVATSTPTPMPTTQQTSMPVPLPTSMPVPYPTPLPISVTITSAPVEATSTATSNSIPPPPSDLNTLCTTGPSVFCQQVCMPAKCCFEVTASLNCFAQNQICREYAACSKLYEN